MRIFKYAVFIFITTLIIFHHNLSAEPINHAIINMINLADNHVQINIRIDSLDVITKTRGEAEYSQILFSNLTQLSIPGEPNLPEYATRFNVTANNLSASYRIIDEEVIQLDHPVEIFYDYAKGADFKTTQSNQQFSIYPQNLMSYRFDGFFRNIPVSSLHFYPVQILSQNTLRLIKNVSIDIHFSQNDLVFNQNSKASSHLFATGKVGQTPKPLKKQSSENPLTGKPFIRLEVSEDGIYRVDYQTLKDMKISIDEINPQTFAMYNQGKQVPIWIYGEKDQVFHNQDFIEFLGKRNPNSTGNTSAFDPFTDINVYQLYWNITNGLRFSEEAAAPTYQGQDLIRPVEYDYLFHFEENEKFQRLGYVHTDILSTDNDQYFFYRQILSGTSQDFEFFLPSPNRNTTKNIAVKAKLQSLAQDIYSTARIMVNGQNIGHNTWYWNQQGYVEQNPEFYIPNNFLKEGINTLTINHEYNTNDQTSSIVLDWLEIQYYRSFIADEDFIEFNKPNDQINGIYQFDVENFSDIDISVYKNNQTKITAFQKSFSEESQTFTIRMQDEINGPTAYIAASGSRLALPDTCFLDTLHNITDIDGCDHLFIVYDDFYETMQEMVDFYQIRGIKAHRVKISDIYNQYNFGIKTPYAIRAFLADAFKSWENFPKWALLVGDANLDNRKLDLLPTVMYQTYKWGGSASDYWYSLLDEDDILPDIELGRWAAGSVPELETLIQKRIQYSEQQTAGPWRNTYLFIAGKEDDFKIQTDFLTEYRINPPASISRILINPSNVNSRFYGGTDTLIARFNRGLRVVNFMGHGGGAVWADRSLFRLEDLYKLKNGNVLPFISSLTCFTADFAASQSLGEAITERFNSGAIGLFGSSGVGWLINDFLLGNEFFKFTQKPDINMGDIINSAKINYVTNSNQFNYLKASMVYQYNLLGDPAIVLAQTNEFKDYLNLDRTQIQPNESVTLSGQLPFSDGKLEIEVYDNRKYPLTQVIPYFFSDNNFSQSLFLPDSLVNNGHFSIHGTNTDETQDFACALYFSSLKNAYKNLVLDPEIPDYGDEINISMDLIDQADSVFWEIDTLYVSTYLDPYGIEKISAWVHTERDSVPYTYIDPITNTEIDTFRYEYVTRTDTDLVRIPCNESSERHYQSSRSFIAINPYKYYAHRIVWYEAGERFEGVTMKIEFNEIYDLEILSLKQGGLDFPALEMEVALHGEDSVETQISVYKGSNYLLLDSNIIYTTVKTLAPNSKETLLLPVISGLDTAVGRIYITGKIKEKVTWNNYKNYNFIVNRFLVSPQYGTTLTETRNDTIWINNRFFINIQPNSTNEPFVLTINSEILSKLSQPDFILNYPTDTEQIKHALTFSRAKTLYKTGKFGFVPQKIRENTQVIEFDPLLNLWKTLPSLVQENIVTGSFIGPGQFTTAQVKDTQIPGIEVNFDGKRIDEQSYVDSYPTISFIFNDDNGINLSEEGLKIWIDDDPIAFSDLIRQDTITNFTTVTCSYRSTLESGRHDIRISIEDAAHNVNEQEFDFNIFKNLNILDYGNYPNPFKTRTWFVFETTKNVEEFKILIYSSSGRKIRTIDDTNIYEDKSLIESGYHEVSWDGKDDHGEDIANGVYYYRMVAKTNNKTVTTKGIIAKVK
ncbi:MAG: hypothetical protein JXQ65_06165 [Candidatus Marinimicrobia bacterium]|nr:hypothetical protein [Candidatus Neomarinimicrobiota bacterium]